MFGKLTAFFPGTLCWLEDTSYGVGGVSLQVFPMVMKEIATVANFQRFFSCLVMPFGDQINTLGATIFLVILLPGIS